MDFKPKESGSLGDLDAKLDHIEDLFTAFTVYKLEFSHLMPNNLSYDSLGNLDPKSDLLWNIETEALSSFSYSLMRSNILALCVEEPFERLRQLLIEGQIPKQKEKQAFIDAQKLYKEEMKGLNSD